MYLIFDYIVFSKCKHFVQEDKFDLRMHGENIQVNVCLTFLSKIFDPYLSFILIMLKLNQIKHATVIKARKILSHHNTWRLSTKTLERPITLEDLQVIFRSFQRLSEALIYKCLTRSFVWAEGVKTRSLDLNLYLNFKNKLLSPSFLFE